MARYWCHSCNTQVQSTPNEDGELVCTTCNGCFVEEMEEDMPEAKTAPAPAAAPAQAGSSQAQWTSFGGQPMQFMYFDSHSPGMAGGFPFPPFAPPPFRTFAQPQSQAQQQQQQQQQQQHQPPPSPFGLFGPSVFNQMFLPAYGVPQAGQAGAGVFDLFNAWPLDLNALLGQMLGPFGMTPGGANMGDYRGANIQDLIAQLMAQDPNRHGPPPAAEQAVGQLPEVKLTEAQLRELKEQDKLTECAVCKEEFEPDVLLKRMPCAHQFHPDCLLPWLKLHNTCPVCRFALPTDDPDYERRRATQVSGTSARPSTQPSTQATSAPHNSNRPSPTQSTPTSSSSSYSQPSSSTPFPLPSSSSAFSSTSIPLVPVSGTSQSGLTLPPTSFSSSPLPGNPPGSMSDLDPEQMPNPWAGL